MDIRISLDKRDERKFIKACKNVPEKVFRRHVGKAANKAMTPVSRDMKKMAPKEEGAYRKSIGKKKKTYTRNKTVWVGVGPRRGYNSYQGHLLEYGHRMVVGGTTMRISGKRAGQTDKADNAALTGKGRVVGFVAARPHIRPALRKNKTKVFNTYRQELRQGIIAEARK